jgi:hypothetical protein
VVRYVHLPGGAVDTALLEDGEFLDDISLELASNPATATRREAAQQSSKAK